MSGAGLKSRMNALPPCTTADYRDATAGCQLPLVAHEVGQWCVYPNFKEIAKYTGVLRAGNFEIFRDSLQAHHMLDQAEAFLMASGKLQAMLYKEEVEAALRTPGFGGFQLLDLHDFPGQERPWSACSIRSGTRRGTSPPTSSTGSAPRPCRWPA